MPRPDTGPWCTLLRTTFPRWGIVHDPFAGMWIAVRGRTWIEVAPTPAGLYECLSKVTWPARCAIMPDMADDERRMAGAGRDTGAEAYVPALSAGEPERIRRWHETAYEMARAEAGTGQTFEYLGRTFEVPPEVQPITRMSHLLGEAVLAEVRPGDRVLDMGTGCGVNAVLAASVAERVLAVDVNPVAVEAARRNAARNGVADRVDVRHGDVFDGVEGRFDLIVFDPPFRWFPPRDLLERAMTDENYGAMTRFFREAPRRLTPAGRMLIFFGTSGDLGYLRSLADRAGFRTEVVARAERVRDGVRVEYFTFRLEPVPPA